MKSPLLFISFVLAYCLSTTSLASLKGKYFVGDLENVHLRISTQETYSTVEFESTSNTPLAWSSLKPILEGFVQETFDDPKYENRYFIFELTGQEILTFHEWMRGLMRLHPYPISFGSSQKTEGDRKDGFYERYRVKFKLRNHTLKETRAREINEYRFVGGEIDETLINSKTLFHLMSRIGFKEKDFENGKTGVQGRILVKPVELVCLTLDSCLIELNAAILSNSKKAVEGHIALVFNLSDQAEFKIDALIPLMHDRNGWIGRLSWPMTIFSTEENRFYLIFRNTNRKVLDLHGFKKSNELNGIRSEAGFHLVKSFIREKYDNFETSCRIITGSGEEHPTSQGIKGVLKTAFPSWLADERIRPLVIQSTLSRDGGMFSIRLVPPVECDIRTIEDPIEQLTKVTSCLDHLLQTNGDRLILQTKDQTLDHQIIHLLASGEIEAPEGVTISFSYAPEQVRITVSYEDDRSGRNLLARSDDMTTTSSDDSDDFSYRKKWKERAMVGPRVTFGNQRFEPPRRIAPRPAPKGPKQNFQKKGVAKVKGDKVKAKQPLKKNAPKQPLKQAIVPKKEMKGPPAQQQPKKKGAPPKNGKNNATPQKAQKRV